MASRGSKQAIFSRLREKREIIRNNHELRQDFSLQLRQATTLLENDVLSESGLAGR